MWTEEQDEFLKKLWANGDSARDIAAEINLKMACKYTRNAVLGRIHRLAIQDTAPLVKKVYTPPKRPKPGLFIVPAERQPQVATRTYKKPEPRYQHKWDCQFFIGDKMCGKESRGPWCDEHKLRVYKQDEPRSASQPDGNSGNQKVRPLRVQNFR